MATHLDSKSIEVRVITAESDIPELARLKTAAFRDSPFHVAMYPVQNEKAMLAFHEARERLEFANPRRITVAVVDTSRPENTVLAWARWRIPLRLVNEQRAASGDPPRLDSISAPDNNSVQAPEGTNIAFRTAFLDWWASLHSTHGIGEDDYELRSLATHPDVRGKGYASMLLKWGIDHAERNRGTILLSSTPMAHGLYLKHGWSDIDEMDFTEYGGPVIKAMSRVPQRG